MRSFAPSDATASDAATTSGLGSGLSCGSQSKNSHSCLKLILCCFLPNSCPDTKFHPNWTKNIDVKMISYQSALVGWTGQSKKAVFISNSFHLVFNPILAPKPNLIEIGWKTQKLKRFVIGQLWYVSWVGQKNSLFKLILCCYPMLSPNWMKNTDSWSVKA